LSLEIGNLCFSHIGNWLSQQICFWNNCETFSYCDLPDNIHTPTRLKESQFSFITFKKDFSPTPPWDYYQSFLLKAWKIPGTHIFKMPDLALKRSFQNSWTANKYFSHNVYISPMIQQVQQVRGPIEMASLIAPFTKLKILQDYR